jgi:regulator of protease activity HflC (stomatin/prohibitin superfamily)
MAEDEEDDDNEDEEEEEPEEEPEEDTPQEEESYQSSSSDIRSVIPIIIGMLPALVLAFFAYTSLASGDWFWTVVFSIGALAVFWIVSAGIGINSQWEESIILRILKFNRTTGPGIFYKIPLFETAVKRDKRTRTTKITAEQALTKDNIPVNIDAIMYWKIDVTKQSLLEIQDFYGSIVRAATTSLRDTIGSSNLDQLLSDRLAIDSKLATTIEIKAKKWGLEVQSVEIKDIVIPTALQDAMSRKAQAEVEKNARIAIADSEVQVAKQFELASKVYEDNPNAMRLRGMNLLYESIKEKGNSIVIVPSDIVNQMGFSGTLGIVSATKKDKPEKTK